jgi:hypothetical protein
MTRRPITRPEPIAGILDAWLDREGRSHRPDRRAGALAVRVLHAFARLGPQVCAHAWATALRGTTLLVEVDQPVWLTELSFLEKEMVAKLNRLVGEPAVRAVRFRLASRRPRGTGAPDDSRADASRRSRAPLSAEARRALDAESARIADPELRALVLRASGATSAPEPSAEPASARPLATPRAEPRLSAPPAGAGTPRRPSRRR